MKNKLLKEKIQESQKRINKLDMKVVDYIDKKSRKKFIFNQLSPKVQTILSLK